MRENWIYRAWPFGPAKNYEENLVTCVLSTDLSSAFDTIDHQILAQKLEFYGIKGAELRLLKSYLNGWQQFVETDCHRSNLAECPPASCIQGSKLSGLIYNIYTCEVPLIQNLMKDQKKFQKNYWHGPHQNNPKVS